MQSTATAAIVILSSDAVFRTSLTSLFESRGHRVSPDLGVATDSPAEVGCVIVDLDRPSLRLTCEWLEARYPNVPTVVLSGSPWSGPHATAGLSCGYFLAKPVPALELAAMVEGFLHDQSLG